MLDTFLDDSFRKKLWFSHIYAFNNSNTPYFRSIAFFCFLVRWGPDYEGSKSRICTMMSDKPLGFPLPFGPAICLVLSFFPSPPWHWAILVPSLSQVPWVLPSPSSGGGGGAVRALVTVCFVVSDLTNDSQVNLLPDLKADLWADSTVWTIFVLCRGRNLRQRRLSYLM